MKRKMVSRFLCSIMALSLMISLGGCSASVDSKEDGSLQVELGSAVDDEDDFDIDDDDDMDIDVDDIDDADDNSFEEAMEDDDESLTFEAADVGVSLYFPEEFDDLMGIIDIYDGGDIGYGTGLSYLDCSYYGVTEDWVDEVSQGEVSQEDIDKYYESQRKLFSVFSIDGGRDAKALSEAINDMSEIPYEEKNFNELAKVGEYTFFSYEDPGESSPEGLEPEFASEFEGIKALIGKVLANAEFYEPVGKYEEMKGKTFEFTTTDLDGNVVKSSDIFAENEITMINVWATWCHWCVQELGELEEINSRLAEKNCAVVGLLGDGIDEETIEEGKELLKENGVTYLNIVPWDDTFEVLDMEGWPSTFFVDSEGKFVGTPVVGAMTWIYEEAVDNLLSGKEVEVDDNPSALTNAEKKYRIYVTDTNAKPVKGAMVQFCSDSTCQMQATDEDGMAAFSDAPGVYTVHILKAPEGFKKHETEYKTPDVYSDLTIILDRE